MFVEEDDVGTPLEESVSGRETGETTTDDDDTSHGTKWREDGGSWGRREGLARNQRLKYPHL